MTDLTARVVDTGLRDTILAEEQRHLVPNQNLFSNPIMVFSAAPAPSAPAPEP